MTNIQTRFSSVEALKSSDVDIHALKSQGRIEVNGKHYDIRAAADGKISVSRHDKQAVFDKFFNGTAHLLGGQSPRSQITQALNEKQHPHPHLRPRHLAWRECWVSVSMLSRHGLNRARAVQRRMP
ncbi:hypothetical protein PSCICM_43460 [Pseudomonas cichorii]|uniref:hypothetical protein n=1 Tax=Pseudomonas cichorii TaxID=36746 RepID=UPI0019ED2CD6|nr:hypothetical protein [Pseudomonas cichorii]GFM78527.1 hypothetical protein PSCICM_43460 [Pseudomonas cichorii]